MDTFKVNEYNPVCKVFTVFLIARIPHSTVVIHFGQGEKGNLLSIAVGSLIAWINVVMIN